MKEAVYCDLFLYVDESCLAYHHRFLDKNGEHPFGRRKTKNILFETKQKLSEAGSLEIRYGAIKIKQYHTATYLGCLLDENLSGESMTLKFIIKINSRLRFLYKKKILPQLLHRLFCNALIESYVQLGILRLS